VAINIALPVGKEVTEDGPKLVGMQAGFKVRDNPAAQGPGSIMSFIKNLVYHVFSSYSISKAYGP
jgi:hypothetical protein